MVFFLWAVWLHIGADWTSTVITRPLRALFVGQRLPSLSGGFFFGRVVVRPIVSIDFCLHVYSANKYDAPECAINK